MPEQKDLFVNREASWLNFNRRVLEEAMDESNAILERVKFLAISSTNLDEFFEVRVAGTMELVEANLPSENPDNLSPREELNAIRREATQFTEAMHRCWKQHLIPALAKHNVLFPDYRELSEEQRKWLRDYFGRDVYPVLTPLAVDPAHPFPSLLNKSLNIAVLLLDSRKGRQVHRIAVVQVPRVLARLVRLPDQGSAHIYLPMADLVKENLDLLFPGFQVLHACAFRVTRDSNLEFEQDESEDLLVAIERELVKRRRGEPVRIEVSLGVHPEILERFLEAFNLESEDVYYCDGPVNLGRLMELYSKEESPGLKDALFVARKGPSWQSPDALFVSLREGDILLHHPFDSFNTIEEFVRHAARDPRVLAIKMTIYRTGEDSSIIKDLILAAEHRKQVTVVVELQARFDEEANIRWAKRMEKAGVHVVYGIVGLKTHAKILLVVRREDDGLKRYCHLGTGNYNPTTARVYMDIGLLTARDAVCQDAADVFNMITGYAQTPVLKELVIAPFALRKRLLGWIERETQNALAGKPARILAKLNAIADAEVILALYRASQAGVKIRLCVRGICCLKPGVSGSSDNIQVLSVVDRFLEHSRIYYFENDGNPELWASSADWMVRNLDRRVEATFPLLDPAVKARVLDILSITLKDNVKAREILADGSFRRLERAPADAPLRSQEAFMEQSRQPFARQKERELKRQKKRLRLA